MTFDPAVYSINENVGSLSPTIRLSQPSTEAFDLIVTIMDVNTTGNAINVYVHISHTHNNTTGDDYTPQAVTIPVTINSPESLSFGINLNNDNIVECTEVFNLVISPTSWCGLASGNAAQVTIINDDGKRVMHTFMYNRNFKGKQVNVMKQGMYLAGKAQFFVIPIIQYSG